MRGIPVAFYAPLKPPDHPSPSGDRTMARLALAGAAVLTFDQVMFYAGLRVLTGAGLPVLLGGWAAKMAAVALYSVLGMVYLRWLERPLRPSRAWRRWMSWRDRRLTHAPPADG